MSAEFPTTARRSRIMSRVRTRDTGPEVLLRSACHRLGLRCRKHVRSLPGTPDAAYMRAKVAVFADGDFWHGRLWFERGKAPRRNREAWVRKFERNRERDGRVDAELRAMGWTVLRFWERDITRDAAVCAEEVRRAVRGVES